MVRLRIVSAAAASLSIGIRVRRFLAASFTTLAVTATLLAITIIAWLADLTTFAVTATLLAISIIALLADLTTIALTCSTSFTTAMHATSYLFLRLDTMLDFLVLWDWLNDRGSIFRSEWRWRLFVHAVDP
jgi:hypothetical protein